MKPIGPLMREHRLIERMLGQLEKARKKMAEEGKADTAFLMTAVDFFRTYADRTHHGKEEDILFRDLSGKQLAPELRQTMDELIEEHQWARKAVTRLVQARERYMEGDKGAVKDLTAITGELRDFYPAHIEKEDKHFFYPILDYLDNSEQERMLDEFREFDRNLIHEKYRKIVEEMEKGSA